MPEVTGYNFYMQSLVFNKLHLKYRKAYVYC